MMRVRTSAGISPVRAIHVRTTTGLKDALYGRARTPSGVKVFFAPVAGIASPDYVDGHASSAGSVAIATGATTATPAGASYAWERVSDDGVGAWSIISPTSATTGFRATGISAGSEANAVFRCTVTQGGSAVTTNDVAAHVENYGRFS